MSLHLKEKQLNELMDAVKRLEDEIEKEKERWKKNDTLWDQLTDLHEYLKYKGYVHANKVTTTSSSHDTNKMSPEAKKAMAKKRNMPKQEKIAHVEAYDEAPVKQSYLTEHNLSYANINEWRKHIT